MIGVAKARFARGGALAIVRGGSTRPLFVTAWTGFDSARENGAALRWADRGGWADRWERVMSGSGQQPVGGAANTDHLKVQWRRAIPASRLRHAGGFRHVGTRPGLPPSMWALLRR